jgi:hypothetical protein
VLTNAGDNLFERSRDAGALIVSRDDDAVVGILCHGDDHPLP